MTLPALKIVSQSFRRFNHDGGWTSAIVISYFMLICFIPLIALFTYMSTKILGNTEIAFRSLNIFTDEFFASLNPAFFDRLQEISGAVDDLGLFGLLGSFVAGSILFSRLIKTLNHIFRARYHKSFFYNRLMEYTIMFVMGVIMFFSLALTALWTAFERSIRESELILSFVNPRVIAFVDNVFVQYITPYLLSFLVFFLLYKLIPEVHVHTRAAFAAAAICALLYEIFKRIFAFYIAHISAIGIVLNRILQGTLTSFIFFLLWISASFIILLWGAEFAALLNERRNTLLAQQSSKAEAG